MITIFPFIMILPLSQRTIWESKHFLTNVDQDLLLSNLILTSSVAFVKLVMITIDSNDHNASNYSERSFTSDVLSAAI